MVDDYEDYTYVLVPFLDNGKVLQAEKISDEIYVS